MERKTGRLQTKPSKQIMAHAIGQRKYQLQYMKQNSFILTLELPLLSWINYYGNHGAFHQSTQCNMVVKSKVCEPVQKSKRGKKKTGGGGGVGVGGGETNIPMRN